MKKKYFPFLIVILQLAFLTGMILFHQAKLESSVRVVLKTVPVDPVSLFRGRYVRLRYEISSLGIDQLRDARPRDLRAGDVVFVRLRQAGDFWQADGMYRRRPRHDTGVFLRARLPSYYHVYDSMKEVQLEFGIEAFFLNEKQARDVENVYGRANNWRETERRRKEGIARLDPETQRIHNANISDWWFKTLDKEMDVWVNEALIDGAAKAAIHDKYALALEKLNAIQREARDGPAASSQKPVHVEVAVDKEGNGYLTRLFCEGKIYQ